MIIHYTNLVSQSDYIIKNQHQPCSDDQRTSKTNFMLLYIECVLNKPQLNYSFLTIINIRNR